MGSNLVESEIGEHFVGVCSGVVERVRGFCRFIMCIDNAHSLKETHNEEIGTWMAFLPYLARILYMDRFKFNQSYRYAFMNITVHTGPMFMQKSRRNFAPYLEYKNCKYDYTASLRSHNLFPGLYTLTGIRSSSCLQV